MASLHAEKMALSYARIIHFLMFLLTPVIFLVNKMAKGVLTLLRVDDSVKGNTITEHELRTLVNVGHKEGVIETEERQMIYNVFDFGDSQAQDVMVPRIDVTFADVNSSYEDLIQLFREEKHTRFPVFEETTDNIIGIINVKAVSYTHLYRRFPVRSESGQRHLMQLNPDIHKSPAQYRILIPEFCIQQS